MSLRHAIMCICLFFIPLYADDTTANLFIKDILKTSVDFNYYLFTRDTMKIITGFMPFYLASRMVDQRINNCFHCPDHHKNLHQFPQWCHNSFDKAVTAELVALSLCAFLPYEQLADVAYVFAVSLPFTWVGKKLLKEIRTDAFVRPKNSLFNWRKKSFHACPSGHMMEATYAATLFGMRLGPAWGVPLGIFAGALFIDFVNANRHFTSQLVAGAGLGVIYAFAADKTITAREERFNCSLIHNSQETGIRLSYNY
jgi:hypothetical protein